MGIKSEEYKRCGNLVYIKKPEFDELEYTKKLWGDYDTMKDIGGIYEFTDKHKKMFFKKMINPTDGKNFYCLVYRNDGVPIGEVSFHGYDSANKIARLNVKIQDMYRGNGYGTEAIKLLLEYYFYEFAGEVIVEKANNKIAENTLLKLGFKETTPKSYRLKKQEFTEKRSICKMEIGIVAFDGTSLSRLGFIAECLSKCDREKIGAVNIDIISKSEVVTSSIGVEFKADAILSSRKIYDVVIFLDGINITKESEATKVIFKRMIESAKNIVAMDSAISTLLELEYLKGMKVVLTNEQRRNYREGVWDVTYVDADYIDNGKFLLLKGAKGSMEGSIYLLEKLYGKNNTEKIKSKI